MRAGKPPVAWVSGIHNVRFFLISFFLNARWTPACERGGNKTKDGPRALPPDRCAGVAERLAHRDAALAERARADGFASPFPSFGGGEIEDFYGRLLRFTRRAFTPLGLSFSAASDHVRRARPPLFAWRLRHHACCWVVSGSPQTSEAVRSELVCVCTRSKDTVDKYDRHSK